MRLSIAVFLLATYPNTCLSRLNIHDSKRRLVNYPENSNPELNEAQKCTIFQFSHAFDSDRIHVDHSSIYGDVCVGMGGELKMNESFLIGNVYTEGTVDSITYDPDFDTINNDFTPKGSVLEADLWLEKASVLTAASFLPDEGCTQSLKDFKPDGGYIISVQGETIICVREDVEFKEGNFHVEGEGTLIIHIGGNLVFDKARVKAVDQMTPSNILFKVLGDDGVKLKGGECLHGFCETEVDGTIVAVGKIEVNPGKVNGQIFSNSEISLKNGSVVVSGPTA